MSPADTCAKRATGMRPREAVSTSEELVGRVGRCPSTASRRVSVGSCAASAACKGQRWRRRSHRVRSRISGDGGRAHSRPAAASWRESPQRTAGEGFPAAKEAQRLRLQNRLLAACGSGSLWPAPPDAAGGRVPESAPRPRSQCPIPSDNAALHSQSARTIRPDQ